MSQPAPVTNVASVAGAIEAEMRALPVRTTSTMRAVRRKYSQALKQANPDFMLQLASTLLETDEYRWVAYELIQGHRAAFQSLGGAELELLGQGINSWWTVDAFARTLSGPAWRDGQIPDTVILAWARSPDHWWRRAALVSTVALNMRSYGGRGDVPRTLQICRELAQEHEDMIVKAMSWALRELIVHDAEAVRAFLDQYDAVLAARVKREVKNKLQTGLKNPGRQMQ